MRLALLLATVCVGLTGCATVKGWFTPAPPVTEAAPPVQVEQPEERGLGESFPSAVNAPRMGPPSPDPPRAVVPRPVAPRPPAPTLAVPTPPVEPPPRVLSPVLSAVDEQKLRADTQQRIDGTEQRLRQIDAAKLASNDLENLQTVQSFLDKAREALQTQDVQRAFTLADKAYLLADDLTRSR